jgi:hypothetical protein
MSAGIERLPLFAVMALTWIKIPGFPNRADPLMAVTEIAASIGLSSVGLFASPDFHYRKLIMPAAETSG